MKTKTYRPRKRMRGGAEPQSEAPVSDLRWTQLTISNTRDLYKLFTEIETAIAANPIDVVRFGEHHLTSIDNRRLTCFIIHHITIGQQSNSSVWNTDAICGGRWPYVKSEYRYDAWNKELVSPIEEYEYKWRNLEVNVPVNIHGPEELWYGAGSFPDTFDGVDNLRRVMGVGRTRGGQIPGDISLKHIITTGMRGLGLNLGIDSWGTGAVTRSFNSMDEEKKSEWVLGMGYVPRSTEGYVFQYGDGITGYSASENLHRESMLHHIKNKELSAEKRLRELICYLNSMGEKLADEKERGHLPQESYKDRVKRIANTLTRSDETAIESLSPLDEERITQGEEPDAHTVFSTLPVSICKGFYKMMTGNEGDWDEVVEPFLRQPQPGLPPPVMEKPRGLPPEFGSGPGSVW
jgi:hypothetical protein